MSFPIIPCDLCGSQDGLQRAADQAHARRVGDAQPGRRQILFRALTQANPSHLLDPSLFDFKAL